MNLLTWHNYFRALWAMNMVIYNLIFGSACWVVLSELRVRASVILCQKEEMDSVTTFSSSSGIGRIDLTNIGPLPICGRFYAILVLLTLLR